MTVRVDVLYFAAVADLVGTTREEMTLPEGVRTVGAFLDELTLLHPALAGRLASVRVARNEMFAKNDEAIASGDVLALIPPVAGG